MTKNDTDDRGETTTYRYISLMEASVDIPAWDVEEGQEMILAGKKPEVWMPNVFSEERDRVIGVRLERKAIAELPEWMKATDAFEWCYENEPDGFKEYYDQQKGRAT